MAQRIALAGNPNSGKTTLFNVLTGMKQHVGNWPGVTVEKKEGVCKKDKELRILDLPGTYSLSPYSAEEVIARNYIVKENPDVVINIVDGTSIERNLYLTLQILETGIPTVVAINMVDEVQQREMVIQYEKIAELLKVPVVPISARKETGIDELLTVVAKVAKEKKVSEFESVFSKEVTAAVEKVVDTFAEEEKEKAYWYATKLLEGDTLVTEEFPDKAKAVKKAISEVKMAVGMDMETLLAEERYKYIGEVVSKTVTKGTKENVETKSDKADKILTNRLLAFPIFGAVMYLLFAATFSENFLWLGIPSPGIWLAGLVESGWEWLTEGMDVLTSGASPWLNELVISCMDGVGAVMGFLPLVLVMFLLLSFLEDSGYMARVAFVMDRIFRHFGLSGRSFIPMLMGFGCGVPAVMAARTLENEKDRKITIIVTTFMSCGAKLPIYIMFISAMFTDSNGTLMMFTIYMIGVIVAILSSLLLGILVKGEKSGGFIMELPQYRIPTVKSVAIHGWEKVKGFAIKAGTVIFFSTILIWLLSSFNFSGMCEMDESFLASIAGAIAVIFKPLGFGEWRAAAGVVTGWIAKENIVATFAQLFATAGAELDADAIMEGVEIIPTLQQVFTKASAWSYMVFNLLCMPCFAAVGAIKREMGSWKWTFVAVGYQMATAYIVSLIVYGVASLIF